MTPLGRIACILQTIHGNAFATLDELTKATDVSKYATRKIVNELVRNGAIRVTRRGRGKKYRLMLDHRIDGVLVRDLLDIDVGRTDAE